MTMMNATRRRFLQGGAALFGCGMERIVYELVSF